MADEITTTIVSRLRNGNLNHLFNPGTVKMTQTNLGLDSGIVVVGLSEEDLMLVDIVTEGVLILFNLEDIAVNPTRVVQYGPKAGTMQLWGELLPGEAHYMRLAPGVTVTWKCTDPADPAQVLFHLYEK